MRHSTDFQRRRFCKQLGVASLALALPACFNENSPKALILGGTNFLGPALVQAYLMGGYEVTLFNRGITNKHLFPDLKKVIGDRSQGKKAYAGLKQLNTQWDVIVDVWPQEPHYVQEALEELAVHTKHYQFASSIAVYASYKAVGILESAPLLPAEQFEEGNYSANKVLCERAVQEYFPNSHTIVRPGAIVGARDPGPFATDLIKRFVQRKEVIAIDSNDPVQIIDCVDIATFLVKQVPKKQSGVYNLVGPEQTLTYRQMIEAIKDKVNPQIKVNWVDPQWALSEAQLGPFTEVPFWIPLADDPEPGFYQISQSAAMAAGLSFTPLEQTIGQAYQSWSRGEYIAEPESEAMFGIEDNREDQLIQAWLQRQS